MRLFRVSSKAEARQTQLVPYLRLERIRRMLIVDGQIHLWETPVGIASWEM
jgi:hypothetical protein